MDNNADQNMNSSKNSSPEGKEDQPKIEVISPMKEMRESLKKDNFSSKKKLNPTSSIFTPNIGDNRFHPGRFSGNKTITDSPLDYQRRFIPNSSYQNYIFNSNYKYENSYSKDFNPINPHLYLNNKDGNICINFFDSKFRDKNFIKETAGNSNLIKKINFDIEDDNKEEASEDSDSSSSSFKAVELDNKIKKPEPRKADLYTSSYNKQNIFSINNFNSKKTREFDEEELLEKYKNKKMTCNCQKSKCLKLYCECFAAGELCYGCNCCNCANIADNAYVRSLIINQMKDKNPSAFKSKAEAEEEKVKHIKGCNCTKSGCLKKYCECFQIGASCTDLCRCRDCKNVDLAKPKPNNSVKIIDENRIVIRKKVLGEGFLNSQQLKFKNFDKFLAETISIQIMNNSLIYEKRAVGLNEEKKKIDFIPSSENVISSNLNVVNYTTTSVKKQKKKAKPIFKKEDAKETNSKQSNINNTNTTVSANKTQIFSSKQLITPIKNSSHSIKTTILNNTSAQIKRNLYTPKYTNNSIQCTTTDKSRKRINIRKGPIPRENLSDRLTKDDIVLNENH